MDQITIIIIQGYTKDSDPHINHLTQIFHDYNIIVIDGENLTESEQYREALAAAGEHTALILKDNSLVDASSIHEHLKRCLTVKADCYFLCAWGDECWRYRKVKDNMYFSSSCVATQAVIFQPHAARYLLEKLTPKRTVGVILGAAIKEHEWKCIVFYPNVVHFDVQMATDNQDYHKLNRCLFLEQEESETNTSYIIWVILIVILVIFLIIMVPYFKHHPYL